MVPSLPFPRCPQGRKLGEVGKPQLGGQDLGSGSHCTSNPCAHPPSQIAVERHRPREGCRVPEVTKQGRPPAVAHAEPWPPSATTAVPSPPMQANLPLLQRELMHCARLAKQTPAQYLAQHEQLLLDANASSPIDSSELLLDVNDNGKRRTPDR